MNVSKRVRRMIALHGGPVARGLYRQARRFVQAYENFDYEMDTNGESALLRRLASADVRTVFDVGANRGAYALRCKSALPHAMVHCFEIVPSTFARLQQATVGASGMKINPFGLSDQAGEIDVQTSSSDGLSAIIGESAQAIHPGRSWQTTRSRVERGDTYCAERNIEHVDLLKIDTEGSDHMVLKGFEAMLTRGAVGLVQFEYGMISIVTKFMLRDFYLYLEPRGFEIGKLMPATVALEPYHPRHEDFRGPNFVAVHKSRPDLKRAVVPE
jgi:FkbM family methyltransferase